MTINKDTKRKIEVKWEPVDEIEKVRKYEVAVGKQNKLFSYNTVPVPASINSHMIIDETYVTRKAFSKHKTKKNDLKVKVRAVGKNNRKGKWSKVYPIESGEPPQPTFIESINIISTKGVDGPVVKVRWKPNDKKDEVEEYMIGWFRGRDRWAIEERKQRNIRVLDKINLAPYLSRVKGINPKISDDIKGYLKPIAGALMGITGVQIAPWVYNVPFMKLAATVAASPVMTAAGAAGLMLGSRTGRDILNKRWSKMKLMADMHVLKNCKNTRTYDKSIREDIIRPEQIGKDFTGKGDLRRRPNVASSISSRQTGFLLYEENRRPIPYYFFVLARNKWGWSPKSELQIAFMRHIPHPAKFNDKAINVTNKDHPSIVYFMDQAGGMQANTGSNTPLFTKEKPF